MRTRFAPSLTGYLHMGHVSHMLHVWGLARAKGAEVLCRIEDHDLGRARPEYESAILENMEWLGFLPDLGITSSTAAGPSPYRQSDCSDRYEAALRALDDQGLVYGCDCGRKEILRRQNGPGELRYDGCCSAKGLPLDGNTVRFRTPKGAVSFNDQVHGPRRQNPREQCGDFSLRDRAGQWTYQFACVVDDIEHGVDLVIRGDDILSSTGRQIQLLEALGASPPRYFHHPLLVDEKGRKLSKRDHAESVAKSRAAGISAEEIIGRAALAAGLVPEYRALSADEARALIEVHYI